MTAAVTAYVAVGSNVDPARHIPDALDRLMGFDDLAVAASSTFYRTPPLEGGGHPVYRNGVWALRTALPPRDMKYGVLREVETALGRVRGDDPNAPRPIDLDLLLYGEVVSDAPDLRLPAPEIAERAFVAVPLLEVAPGLRLPDGTPLGRIASALDDDGLVPDAALTASLRNLLAKGTG